MSGSNPTNDGEPIEYTELYLTIPDSIYEATCNFIAENYSSGLIEKDLDDKSKRGIVFYVDPDNFDIESVKDKLSRYINEISDVEFTPDQIATRVVQNRMWEDEYRKSVKPILIGDIMIRPPWVDPKSASKFDIVIEPKMAFGTGTHETTSLCVRQIYKCYKPGASLLDLGCGSGILSILAAKMCGEKSKIVGIDIDPIAVENSNENKIINNVEWIEILEGSIDRVAEMPKFDFVVANIILETIEELFDQIYNAAKEGGTIILSGLLIQDREPIEILLSKYKLAEYDISVDGEWLAFHIIKR